MRKRRSWRLCAPGVFFSYEDKATDTLNPQAKAISLKFTVNSVSRGVRWMGSRDFDPADVQNNRCRLEISRGAGLLLNDTSVQIITNRGAVALTLPLSKATVTGNLAAWNFQPSRGSALRSTSGFQHYDAVHFHAVYRAAAARSGWYRRSDYLVRRIGKR